MDKLNIGILGCANVAKKNAIPALKSISYVGKIFIASRDAAKAAECASQYGLFPESSYESLVNRDDIAAVYIPLPINLNEEWAIKAANEKRHIICEKSLSSNLRSVQRILDACKKNDVILYENFMCGYHPQHSVVQETIQKGEIGEPFVLHGNFGIPHLDLSNFRYSKELGGGVLNDLGAYTVFMSRKIFGSEPIAVTASLSIDEKLGVDTAGTAFLEFLDGKVAQIAFGFGMVYQNNYSVWGSKGVITVNRAYSIPADFQPDVELYKNESLKESRTRLDIPKANQFELIFRDFLNVVLSGNCEKKEEKYDSILNQARVLEAIRISARENRKVFIKDIR